MILWLDSHQNDKHLGSTICKILGTILEVDERRISTSGLEDKKANANANDKAHPRNGIDRLYAYQENKKEEDSPDLKIVWIHRND